MEVRNSIHLDDGMSPVLSKILASLRLTLTALNSTPGEAGLEQHNDIFQELINF